MNKEYIFAGLVLVICTVLFVLAIAGGTSKEEVVECRQWASDAAQYNGFYIVQWQADQCKAHGITIDAPVK